MKVWNFSVIAGQTDISDLDLVFASHSFPQWMGEAALRYWDSMDSIPVDKVLKMTHLDLQKRFPIFHVCPKCLAALLCGSAFLWNDLDILQGNGWGGNDTRWLVTWEFPLRIDSASWKYFESFIQFTSFCKTCTLPISSKIVWLSSTNFHLAKVSKKEHWNFLNSSISLRLFWWPSRNSEFCCNYHSWKSCWSRRWSFSAWNSCLLIFAWHSARIRSFCLSNKILICAFWLLESAGRPAFSPTSRSVLSDADDDWPTDKSSSLRVMDMYFVSFTKHILECGVIVLGVLGKPLLGEVRRRGQELCVGLDVSFLEVVSVGLIICDAVGVVKRVHILFGGVHRLAAALKRVEEVQKKVQLIKDEWEDEEVERNGGLKVEGEPHTSCMDEMTYVIPLGHAVQCVSHDDTNLTNKQENCALTCQCLCSLCWRCSSSWWSRCHLSCSLSSRRPNTKYSFFFLDFVVRFCTCSQTVFCDRRFLSVANYCTLLHRWKRVIWGDVFTFSTTCTSETCTSEPGIVWVSGFSTVSSTIWNCRSWTVFFTTYTRGTCTIDTTRTSITSSQHISTGESLCSSAQSGPWKSVSAPQQGSQRPCRWTARVEPPLQLCWRRVERACSQPVASSLAFEWLAPQWSQPRVKRQEFQSSAPRLDTRSLESQCNRSCTHSRHIRHCHPTGRCSSQPPGSCS